MQINNVSASGYSSAASATSAANQILQSSTELTVEEQEYDTDGDGVLSAAEKAAMAQAQQIKQAQPEPKPKPASADEMADLLQKMQSEATLNQSALINMAFDEEA